MSPDSCALLTLWYHRYSALSKRMSCEQSLKASRDITMPICDLALNLMIFSIAWYLFVSVKEARPVLLVLMNARRLGGSDFGPQHIPGIWFQRDHLQPASRSTIPWCPISPSYHLDSTIHVTSRIGRQDSTLLGWRYRYSIITTSRHAARLPNECCNMQSRALKVCMSRPCQIHADRWTSVNSLLLLEDNEVKSVSRLSHYIQGSRRSEHKRK